MHHALPPGICGRGQTLRGDSESAHTSAVVKPADWCADVLSLTQPDLGRMSRGTEPQGAHPMSHHVLHNQLEVSLSLGAHILCSSARYFIRLA